MRGADRWLGSIMWKGRLLHVDEVRRIGRCARCETGDHMLYEYDHEQFWVTALGAEKPERGHHPDHSSVPIGPWFYEAGRDCQACRPESE
jgi:hypothetical protein